MEQILKQAYEISDVRVCKIDGVEKIYHFCSPSYTELASRMMKQPNIVYLGKGDIMTIRGIMVENEKNLHFWRMETPDKTVL